MILLKPFLFAIIGTGISKLLHIISKKIFKKSGTPVSFLLNATVIIYFLSPHIVFASIELFNCQNLNDDLNPQLYLVQDPSIKCWKGSHTAIAYALGLPMAIIFGLLIPLLQYFKMRQYLDEKDGSKSSPTKLGATFHSVLAKNSLQKKYFYWQLLIVVRKSLVIVFLVTMRS